jgi:sulfite reductase alpha subunit-like flavoprotein
VVRYELSITQIILWIHNSNPRFESFKRSNLTIVTGLCPRYYSVASSPLAQPTTISVALSVVRYNLTITRGGNTHTIRRRGVCSAWLDDVASGVTAGEMMMMMTMMVMMIMMMMTDSP